MARIYNVQTAATVQYAARLAGVARRSNQPDAALACAVEVLLEEADLDEVEAVLKVTLEARRQLAPAEAGAPPAASPSDAPPRPVPCALDASSAPGEPSDSGAEGAIAAAEGSPGSPLGCPIDEQELLTSGEVGDLLGSTSHNRRQYAMELRQRGAVLGVRRKNAYVYPRFQFDPHRRLVHPVVEQVNRRLGAAQHPWGVLRWWTSPNDRLPGSCAPRELLESTTAHATLTAAAEAAAPQPS